MNHVVKMLGACSFLCLVTGCGEKPATAPNAGAPAAPAEAADHAHGAGPHGGAVADWGGGAYHVEFTVDHGKKESTVYVLASDAKTPAPIQADTLLLSINDPAFQIELTAQPLEGETGDASSRFVGQHDNLGIVREFAGSITGEVGGNPYAGDFTEVADDHAP